MEGGGLSYSQAIIKTPAIKRAQEQHPFEGASRLQQTQPQSA